MAAAPAAGRPDGSCRTPLAEDGQEPACNPALATSPWPAPHRGGYAQASTPWPAPRPGQPIAYEHAEVNGIPIILTFSSRYRDGGTAVWGSTVGTSVRAIKLDAAAGKLIDSYTAPSGENQQGAGGGGATSGSGVYSLLDRDNRLIVGRDRSIEVYGDSVPGQRASPIARLQRFELPQSALCRASDRLVGLAMLDDGMLAFATRQGVVGVLPRRPSQMSARSVKALSLNGAACGDPNVADDRLEGISNSIAVDEQGGIYPVTSRAQYKLRWDGRSLVRVWRAAYETGGGQGGARVGEGSGSTPTLMGTDASRDRFVVITDGQKLMRLVLMWRDGIPKGWRPIAPGKDPRIACEVSVTFGDPNATDSVSEQSVLVRGYASVVVNNRLRLDDALAQLPDQLRPLTVLSGQEPGNAPYGLERIDWDPKSRTCKPRWANREVSIPNGVPTMSTKSNLVYGIGQRGGVWGLEGLDFGSGQRRLWRPTSGAPTENSFFAATTIGPQGTVWTGTFLGVTVFRPPPMPDPGFRDPRCIGSMGGLRGKRVGPARLGRRRSVQRRVLKNKPLGRRGGMDRYCVLGGGALRIGYPTRRLRRTYPGRALVRRRRGRALIVLTTSRRFSIRGVRRSSGTRRLRGMRRVRVGRNLWYLAPGKSSRLLFKTRRGRVLELGIGDKRLTRGRRTTRRFLDAWHLRLADR